MKRQIEQNALNIQTFIRGKYYFIKNLSNNLYLTVDKSISNELTTFDKQNNFDLQMVWMIQEIAKQTYQITHPYSSFTLEIIENSVKLKPNKLKNSQTFYFDKSNASLQNFGSNIFLIKEFKQSKKCLFTQNGELKCQERPLFKEDCNKWKIQLITDHPLIMQSCIIQNYNSGLVISINQSRQTAGQRIVQNLMSNHFSQRWQILKKNQFFVIKSLKSGLVLDINHQKMKEGNNIIQWILKDSLNQLWILEQHGKRIYIIRSAMNKDFMLGIKGNSLKDQAELIITKNQSEAFWKITGPISF